tara:strand:+ start:10221 stop:10967 length:747 start_codon:yes stop_codon:yes gene_type:complete
MIELNLVPDVKQELLKAQRTRSFVISASIVASIIAGGLVVLFAAYIFIVQAARSSYLDGQIENKSTELAEVADLSEMLTIQNQLERLAEINANKKIDSRIFDMIAAVVPPEPNNVQFSLVRVETANPDAEDGAATIRLEGQTRAYDSMEVFKKTLASAIIVYVDEDGVEQSAPLAADISTSDVSFGENDAGEQVVRFALTFSYPEELFSAQYSAITFKLSIDGNVTDSYLGVPKEIFTERADDVEEGN